MKLFQYCVSILLTAIFLVIVSCSSGAGSDSAALTDADIPSDVSASFSSSGDLEISWSGSANDSHYKIAILSQSTYESSAAVNTVEDAASTQSIGGLTSGTYYAWVVQMLTDGSEGEAVAANDNAPLTYTASSGESGTSAAQNAEPDTPGDLAITTGEGTITVTWSGNANSGSYKIIVDDDAIPEADTISEYSNAVSGATVSGLDSGSYYVWVIALDSTGSQNAIVAANGGYAIEVSNPATDPADTPTSVALSVTESGNGTLSLSWDGAANGGSYTVVLDNDPSIDNDTVCKTIEHATSPLEFDSLTSATYYAWVIPLDTDDTEGTAVTADEGAGCKVYNGTLSAAADTVGSTTKVYRGIATEISIATLLDNDQNNMTSDPLEIIEIKNIENCTAVLNSSTITVTSTSEDAATASFTYVAQIKDVDLFSVEAAVTVTISELPAVGVVTESYSVQQGATTHIKVSELLSNDIGTDIELVNCHERIGGSVSRSGNTITFTSTGLAYEVTAFDYTIQDSFGTTASGSVSMSVTPLPELEAYVYNDAEDFEEEQATYEPQTMDDVFSSWARFDGNDYFADESEVTTSSASGDWVMSSTYDSIYMPTNVTPYNGFLSPQSLENYTFEVTVSSSSGWDNDNVGAVIAFTRQEVDTDDDGTADTTYNYTLTAIRNRGGMKPYGSWGVVYNVGEGPTHSNCGLDKNGGKIIQEMDLSSIKATGAWNNHATRIKVVREGDTITCYTTAWDDVDPDTDGNYNYVADSKITFNLSEDTDLEKFSGAKPYGYVTFSEPNSYYEDISITGALEADVMSNIASDGTVTVKKYDEETESWVEKTTTLQELYGYVRIITNPATGQSFLIKKDSVELISE